MKLNYWFNLIWPYFLTSEFESKEVMGRFLLPTLEVLRVESITVGVIVREFVLSTTAIVVLGEFDKGKLILTGVFGSNGKNERGLLTVELGGFISFDIGLGFTEDGLWSSVLVGC